MLRKHGKGGYTNEAGMLLKAQGLKNISKNHESFGQIHG